MFSESFLACLPMAGDREERRHLEANGTTRTIFSRTAEYVIRAFVNLALQPRDRFGHGQTNCKRRRDTGDPFRQSPPAIRQEWGVGPLDLPTWTVVSGCMLAVAGIASYLP